MRFTYAILGCLSVALAAASILWSQAQSDPQSIRSPRPMNDVARQLGRVYGKIVTYEDPIWAWQGDLQLKGGNPDVAHAWYPAEVNFKLATPAGSHSDAGTELAKRIEEYHQQSGGPRFRVLRSKLGLHIIPVEVRDASGTLVAARNPLDALITTVAEEERTVSGHLRALTTAISITSGLSIQFASTLENKRGDALEQVFGAEQFGFRWGATGVKARDALIDLLDRSATSLSWSLLCPGDVAKRHEPCNLNVAVVEVAVATDDGKGANKLLLFDRCGRCPPLRPFPPLDSR